MTLSVWVHGCEAGGTSVPSEWENEERPKLENLVVLGKGLRRRGTYSAETGDEGRGEPEAADLRDTSPTRLWREERDGSRVATLLGGFPWS